MVFLVEVLISGKMEPISLKETEQEAFDLVHGIKPESALVTEIEIGAEYKSGLGVCKHWHYDDSGWLE